MNLLCYFFRSNNNHPMIEFIIQEKLIYNEIIEQNFLEQKKNKKYFFKKS